MSVPATPAVFGRRACAVLAATSAVLHGVMLGHAANPAMSVLMAGMAVVCLYCARELWMRGTLRVWVVVALMNLAMIALHLPAPGAHHHAAAATAEQQSTIMALATTVSMVEVGLAAAVLWFRTRRAAQLVTGRPVR
jgi:NADH:ubiquinone oxidoreductase subunit K